MTDAELDFRKQPERPAPSLKTAEHVARTFNLDACVIAFPAGDPLPDGRRSWVLAGWQREGAPHPDMQRVRDQLGDALVPPPNPEQPA